MGQPVHAIRARVSKSKGGMEEKNKQRKERKKEKYIIRF